MYTYMYIVGIQNEFHVFWMLTLTLRSILGRKNTVSSICWGACGFFPGTDIGVEVISIFLPFFLEEGDSKGSGVFSLFCCLKEVGKKYFKY